MFTFVITLGLVLAAMVGLWLLSLALRDASIADLFWGAGFALVAIVSWKLNEPTHSRTVLLVALTVIWGLRLSAFLMWRNWGRGEDRRYAQMREHRPRDFWWFSLFSVFLLQSCILWLVSLPIQTCAVLDRSSPWNLFDAIGLAAWGVGLFFEAVGDWQLARFKALPENAQRVMDRGLWRYTRHPNYFGDFCVWWGHYFLATAGGAWWTFISPVIMSILLMRISGVTLLERTISRRRPEYVDYQTRTNAFFPGPRRRLPADGSDR